MTDFYLQNCTFEENLKNESLHLKKIKKSFEK